MQQAVTGKIFMSPHRDSSAIIDRINYDDCIGFSKRDPRGISRFPCRGHHKVVEKTFGLRCPQVKLRSTTMQAHVKRMPGQPWKDSKQEGICAIPEMLRGLKFEGKFGRSHARYRVVECRSFLGHTVDGFESHHRLVDLHDQHVVVRCAVRWANLL